ncbi:MAG: YbhN family protein [Pleurocapsa sp.]
MKSILATIKPYLGWVILGVTLFFLAKAFKDSWREIAAVRVDLAAWMFLSAALIVTLLAHVWSGWVWKWILSAFKISIGRWLGIKIYLTTNIAKYLPGNVWHFSGRIIAVSQHESSIEAATLSVLLEPLLMAAAALSIGLISMSLGWLETNFEPKIIGLQFFCLAVILTGIHPHILNPLIARLSRQKIKQGKIFCNFESKGIAQLNSYPLKPFLGEIGFVIFRGLGFLLTFMAFHQLTPLQIPSLISTFCFAWLFGLILPGAPGGIGVFEATAIALLNHNLFPTPIVLTTVAYFRLISILAEAIAAGLAYLACQRSSGV